jgi:HemY protein
MKLLFLSLLALLLAVTIGSLAGYGSGYFMMTIAGWTIQTTATLFVIVLFLGFLLLYFVVRTLVNFIKLPKDIQIWQKHRHQRCAEKYITQGLINMTEGRWKQAERDFCKAAHYSRAPYVNYLCAARAAQKLHAVDRRDEYLRIAYHNNPDASLAVGITQAELQLSEHQTEQALATLKHLENEQPGQNQVKQLLLDTYTDLNDWQSVLNIIPSIEQTSVYTCEQILARQLEAYVGLLKEAGAREDKQTLDSIWVNIPRKLKQYSYLIEVYVTERLRFDNTADCELLLKTALKRQWDHMLVRLYGLVVAVHPSKQQATAESWLNNHTRDAVLLLTLGRICLRNELWGKARDYLQDSIDLQANFEAYYEFARLLEHEGNREAAAECYEKGLALATGM